MVAASAMGDELKMFVLAKSKSASYLKGVKHLHCKYRNPKQCLVESILFEEWVEKMDKKFPK